MRYRITLKVDAENQNRKLSKHGDAHQDNKWVNKH